MIKNTHNKGTLYKTNKCRGKDNNMLKRIYDTTQLILKFCVMLVVSFSYICIFTENLFWSINLGKTIAWILSALFTIILLMGIIYKNNLYDNYFIIGAILASIFLMGSSATIIFVCAETVVFFLCVDGQYKKEIVDSSIILYIAILFEAVSFLVILFPNYIDKVNQKIFSSIIIDVFLIVAVCTRVYKARIAELCLKYSFFSVNRKKCIEINFDKYRDSFIYILGCASGLICTCIYIMRGQVYWEYYEFMDDNSKYIIYIVNIVLIIIQLIQWYCLSKDFLSECEKKINIYVALIVTFVSNVFISVLMFSTTMLIYTLFVTIILLFARLINNRMEMAIAIGGIAILQIYFSFVNRLYAVPIINLFLFVGIIFVIKKLFINKQHIVSILAGIACCELIANFFVVNNYILRYENDFFDVEKFCDELSDDVKNNIVYCDKSLTTNEIKFLNTRGIVGAKTYTSDLGEENAVVIKNDDITSEVLDSYIVKSTDEYTCLVKNNDIYGDTSKLKYMANLEPDSVNLSIVEQKWNKDDELVARVSFNNNHLVEYYNSQWENTFLSYHIYDKNNKMIIWDGIRTSMDEIIDEKGQLVSFDLSELKPGKKYYYEIDIVEEGVRWFSVEGMKVARGQFVMK